MPGQFNYLRGLLAPKPYESVMDGYQPPKQEVGYINTEPPLTGPSIAGGLLSLDPTDYIGPQSLAKAGMAIKGLLGGVVAKGGLLGAGLGMIKGKTVPVMTWDEWQRHFPNIGANESYEMWKSQASNQVEGTAKQLVDKLKGIGVNAEKDNPYAYHNAIGGISSYNHIPGYGEVRISDHLRSSGLAEDRTFGNADDAFNAIKGEFARSLQAQKERELLRAQIGLTDEMTRKQVNARLQDWIVEQGFTGKDKDLYPWINKVGN